MSIDTSRLAREIDQLQGVRGETAAAREEFRAAVARVQSSEDYTDQFKADETASLQGRFNAKLTEIRTRANALHQSLALGARHALEGSTDAELGIELREQRAWQRAKAALDAGADWAELIDQAKADRDLPTLSALRAELPAWLATYALTASDINNRPDAQQAAKTATEEAVSRLDLAEGAVAPGERGTAAKVRARLAAVWPSVETELQGAQLDAIGKPLAGMRRLGEAYAQDHAERAQQTVTAEVGASV